MKCFGPYTGYALQQELDHIPVPVGESCAHCDEPFLEDDTGIVIPSLPEGGYPYHWNCHLRSIFGSVAHIEGRCSCFVPGASCGDPEELTRRQAADAAVAAYFWKHKREV